MAQVCPGPPVRQSRAHIQGSATSSSVDRLQYISTENVALNYSDGAKIRSDVFLTQP
jgi:hypothetical protein